MWRDYVFVMFTLFHFTGTMLLNSMDSGHKNKVSVGDGNNTNNNLISKQKQITGVDINDTGVDYNDIMYDKRYISLAVNITSKYRISESTLELSRLNSEFQPGFLVKMVTAGNQTVKESIDPVAIRIINCCVINKWKNITAQKQEQYWHDKNGSIVANVVHDMNNRSNGRVDTEAALTPEDTRPIRDGFLSENQHDTCVEIIKAVKCALNVIALFMTLLSVVAFSRTKHFTSSTTFIMALNICGFIAALLSLVGYTLSFSLGTTSETYLVYTKYFHMYAGAVCRRIVYLLNMLMSGQRFTVITLPFLARRKFRNSINVVIIVVVVVVTCGTHAYLPACYIVAPRGGDVFSLRYSPLYKSNTDSFETASTATKFLFAFLPLTASLLANILLLAYLKHHARTTQNLRMTRKTDEAFSRQNRQVTLIVLVSSVSFTLFSFPANIHLLATSYTGEYGYRQKDHYLFMVVHEALLGLLTLGDIANFLSYLFLSSAFRSQLRSAFQTTSLLGFQRPNLTVNKSTLGSSSCTVYTVTRSFEAARNVSR